MQAIEQENLARLQLDGFGGGAAALLEAVDRLLNCLAREQAGEMTVEQLDVQRFGRLVVAVVDPVGGMLDERPEIVVQVEHEKAQALLLQPFGELDRGGGLAGGAGAADPHHAELVAGIEAPHDLPGSLVERLLVKGERFVHQRFDLPAADNLVQAGDGVAAVLPVPGQRLVHLRSREAVADKLIGA